MNMRQSTALQERRDDSLVSIIVPVYNCQTYLADCLNSICGQSYKNLEIVLVDDGSTDGSGAICEAYKKRDARIKVIHQENQGLICARRTGVRNACGTMIGFVDADDWIEEKMFERLIGAMKEYDAEMISSGLTFVYEDGRPDKFRNDVFEEGCYTGEKLEKEVFSRMIWDQEACRQGMICSMVNKLFLRDKLLTIQNRIDENITHYEDAVCYVYALSCCSIYIMKDSYYSYRQHNTSMVHTLQEELLQNAILLFRYLEREVSCYSNKYILLEQLNYFMIDYNKHLMKQLFQIDLNAMDPWDIVLEKDVWNSKIVIYGAGQIGRVVYQAFGKKKARENVVAWIDKYPEGKARTCLHDIEHVEYIKKCNFDYIIIAVQERAFAEQIKEYLRTEYDLPQEKIVLGTYTRQA